MDMHINEGPSNQPSTEVTWNAKGEAQVHVKVYDDDELRAARRALDALDFLIQGIRRRGFKMAGDDALAKAQAK